MFKNNVAISNDFTASDSTYSRFDQITLDNLKQDIQQAIQAGQEFLNTLTAAPSETDQQLAVLEQIDARK